MKKIDSVTSWATIKPFIDNGVAKYVYAFPSVLFTIITSGIFVERIVGIVANTYLLSNYLYFSIIYTLCGLAFSVFCPSEIRQYKTSHDYVSGVSQTTYSIEIGAKRSLLNLGSISEKNEVLHKYYEYQNYKNPFCRYTISAMLLLGVIPPFIGSIRRVVETFGLVDW